MGLSGLIGDRASASLLVRLAGLRGDKEHLGIGTHIINLLTVDLADAAFGTHESTGLPAVRMQVDAQISALRLRGE